MSGSTQPRLSVGKRVAKLDAAEKVTGRAAYTKDVQLPGMLHGALLRSPHPHAEIKSIRLQQARELPGVKAILTHEDIPKIPYNPAGHPAAFPHPPLDKHVIESRPRFVGDIVAAVAAESMETALKALTHIQVEYELLPSVLNPFEAMQPGAPLIHPNLSSRNLATPNGQPIRKSWGDLEKGFRDAELVVEQSYETPIQCHVCLETTSCIAWHDPLTGRLTLWASSQVPFLNRHLLAYVLGIPESQIRVIVPHLGGGFGSRQELCDIFPIACLLSMRTGRPVKLALTRTEEFTATRTRHAMFFELKAGAKKDGTLTAIDLKVVSDTGAYASHGSVVLEYGALLALSAYKVPNKRLEGYCVYTNKPVAAAFRGYGNLQFHFALETHMDILAERLGIDPVELRLKNYVEAGDRLLGVGQPLGSVGIRECLTRGAEAIGWRKRKPAGRNVQALKAKGLGMAVGMHSSGAKFFVAELSEAQVRWNPDGSVYLYTGALDCGQGNVTALAQITAEELGLPLEKVIVMNPPVDTDLSPYDLGAYASRTTYVVGGAVRRAAAEAKHQLLEIAARYFDVQPRTLRLSEGKVRVEGRPGSEISVSDLLLNALEATQGATYILGRAIHEPVGLAPPFAAHFAEVEVDLETGQVSVLRYVAAHDVGRAINPMNVEGQIQGGVVQGLGFALSENLVIDAQTANAVNPDLLNYKLPTAMEIPEINVLLVESEEPSGPFGAKSVGEIGLIPVPATICNAIYNAIGIRITQLPITPEKIVSGLRSGRAAKYS